MNAMNGLTHTEVVNLKRQLEKENVRVGNTVHDGLSHGAVGEADGVVQYRETTDDDAIADVLNDAAISSIQRETASLEAIEKSLHAIADGSYGGCVDCGRHIGLKRLTANPTSMRCTHCQTKREKYTLYASL